MKRSWGCCARATHNSNHSVGWPSDCAARTNIYVLSHIPPSKPLNRCLLRTRYQLGVCLFFYARNVQRIYLRMESPLQTTRSFLLAQEQEWRLKLGKVSSVSEVTNVFKMLSTYLLANALFLRYWHVFLSIMMSLLELIQRMLLHLQNLSLFTHVLLVHA